MVEFDGKHGQLEIGGKYIGVEFHRSRPLPSRISYYYPVANSIDLSTSYWKRAESTPLTVMLTSEGKTDTIGKKPFKYKYTPFCADFEKETAEYRIEFSYHFCDDLPVMVFRTKIKNLSPGKKEFAVSTSLNMSLRTSHTYSLKNQARLSYINSGTVALTKFDDISTDSALVFVANAGDPPRSNGSDNDSVNDTSVSNPKAYFEYKKTLEPDKEMVIVQLIGSCRQPQGEDIINKALQDWGQEIQKTSQRIHDYVWDQAKFTISEPAFQQTANWSKAMLAANIHYLNEWFLPMPCPAEYNFFFTHDFLLTSLSAVLFDLDWVKNGYRFLHSVTLADSILPHAFYWKDDGFKTEFCHTDNWNHLWFIISASSYLKHSADKATINLLFPTIYKSVKMMLENQGEDNLMYASRPDWWDIGDVYGARAYITSLTIRALQDYVFITTQLGKTDGSLETYIQLAEKMKKHLIEQLWDEDAGYLMNMLDRTTPDKHFYSGSLVAAWFDVLDQDKRNKLLQSAEEKLLDKQIGIRNVMPANFHELTDIYKFKESEAGEHYVYFNGAVWPHGTAWYILGLIANNQPNEAKAMVQKYLTLEGITHSPNGQPSFYEYRMTDPESPRYGEIDKPTFLWAAGWYLNILFKLSGVRENSWNISFNPRLPQGFDNVEYDLNLFGKLGRVRWKGQGKYFRKIILEGEIKNSAIVLSPAPEITLERGQPSTPYLANANCHVEDVSYIPTDKLLVINTHGFDGQEVKMTVISPEPSKGVILNGTPSSEKMSVEQDTSVYVHTVHFIFKKKTTVQFIF